MAGGRLISQKRVLISGYYGFNNAGDEAVLAAMLQQLRSACPEWHPVVLSADPAATSRLHGVEAADRWKLGEVVRAIRRCDLFISGGGSLFQDATSRTNLLYYLGLIWLARLFGKPVFVYAQGVGPLQGRGSRFLVGATLRRVQGITVRDEESAALLASLGLNSVTVTADPVLALEARDLADFKKAQEVLHRLGIERGNSPLAVLSLRELPRRFSRYQDRLEQAAAGLIKALRERGWQVVLLPLQWPQDWELCRRLHTQLPQEPLSLPVLLGLIGFADLVVGMRLHALIFAALVSRPLAGIVYDPKVAAFLRELDAPGLDVQELAPSTLAQTVWRAWEQREPWLAALPRRLTRLKERAAATVYHLRRTAERNLFRGQSV